jgi:hypothetical protein
MFHLISLLFLWQVRVTPISAFPVGVTVTPSTTHAPRMSSHSPALKIIPNIGLGGIQVSY